MTTTIMDQCTLPTHIAQPQHLTITTTMVTWVELFTTEAQLVTVILPVEALVQVHMPQTVTDVG